jgi:hypothetical protein
VSFYQNHGWRDRISREESQLIHCQKRAKQRYGIELTPELYQQWIDAIQDKEPGIWKRALGRESLRLTHFAITHGEIEVPVVYDRQTKTIKTILPESGLLGPNTSGA